MPSEFSLTEPLFGYSEDILPKEDPYFLENIGETAVGVGKSALSLIPKTPKEWVGSMLPGIGGAVAVGGLSKRLTEQQESRPTMPSGTPAPQPDYMPPALPTEEMAQEKTAAQRSDLIQRIDALRRRGGPDISEFEEKGEEHRTLAHWSRMNEAAEYKKAVIATAETVAASQSAMEARQLEIDKVLMDVNRYKKEYGDAIEDSLVREMNPNMPEGVENARGWLTHMQNRASDTTLTPEQREEALEALQDAKPKTGMQEAFGSWWRVLLGAVSMALGVTGEALGAKGGTKAVMDSIYRGIDHRVKEKMQKHKRIQRIGAIKRAGVKQELDVSKSEYDMLLEMQAFEIRKTQMGIQSILSQANLSGKEHQAAALDHDLEAKYQDVLGQRAMLESARKRTFDLSALGLEAQVEAAQARGRPGMRDLPASATQDLADLQSGEQMIEELEASFRENTNPASVIAQFVPGTGAKDYESARQVALFIITKGLTGAQFSYREMERYDKALPKSTTWDSTAKNMFKNLRKLYSLRKDKFVKAFGGAGFGGIPQQQPKRTQSAQPR